MDEPTVSGAFIAALTTEHAVLQSAATSTISEAAARSSLYIMALSSSLVAMGFFAQSRNVLIPFAAAVLPALFLLGVFTTVRLVDTGIESMQYLIGIARVRETYRTFGPLAVDQFSRESGRWPEAQFTALRLGRSFALLGTTASMIAAVNSIVAGAAVTLCIHMLLHRLAWISVPAGVMVFAALMWAFLVYQAWRFRQFDGQTYASAADGIQLANRGQ